MRNSKLAILDLFSGIGGFSLGLERTGGFSTVAFCDKNPFSRRVLAKYWPEVPRYEDVTTLSKDRLAADGLAGVDVICGGFPCQDISDAGLRAGLAGERSGLWFQCLRLVWEIRPRYLVVENVSALRRRGLDEILRGLAAIGYDAEWHCIPACTMGASHVRDRVWIVAYPCGHREEELVKGPYSGLDGSRQFNSTPHLRHWPEVGSTRPGDDRWIASALCRSDDGVPDRVDRITALGNSLLPDIPEMIGRFILAAELRTSLAA